MLWSVGGIKRAALALRQGFPLQPQIRSQLHLQLLPLPETNPGAGSFIAPLLELKGQCFGIVASWWRLSHTFKAPTCPAPIHRQLKNTAWMYYYFVFSSALLLKWNASRLKPHHYFYVYIYFVDILYGHHPSSTLTRMLKQQPTVLLLVPRLWVTSLEHALTCSCTTGSAARPCVVPCRLAQDHILPTTPHCCVLPWKTFAFESLFAFVTGAVVRKVV